MIFLIPPTVRVFLFTVPADMRRSSDGLAAMTEHVFCEDRLSGHLFVFRNHKGDRMKILFYDRSGFAVHVQIDLGHGVSPDHGSSS